MLEETSNYGSCETLDWGNLGNLGGVDKKQVKSSGKNNLEKKVIKRAANNDNSPGGTKTQGDQSPSTQGVSILELSGNTMNAVKETTKKNSVNDKIRGYCIADRSASVSKILIDNKDKINNFGIFRFIAAFFSKSTSLDHAEKDNLEREFREMGCENIAKEIENKANITNRDVRTILKESTSTGVFNFKSVNYMLANELHKHIKSNRSGYTASSMPSGGTNAITASSGNKYFINGNLLRSACNKAKEISKEYGLSNSEMDNVMKHFFVHLLADTFFIPSLQELESLNKNDDDDSEIIKLKNIYTELKDGFTGSINEATTGVVFRAGVILNFLQEYGIENFEDIHALKIRFNL
jgi:hypothetical protein